MKIFWVVWLRYPGHFFHILLKTGGIESDILMPPEIEIPVWNFTQINQEWGQIAYFDNPISAYTSPNTGPKNLEVVSKVRYKLGSIVYAQELN